MIAFHKTARIDRHCPRHLHRFGQRKRRRNRHSLTAFYTAPVASMAPMWIAKEAGFFKKNGLDVKLVFIASGPVGTTSMLGSEADVGIIGGFAPIRAMVGGAKDLVIIGQSKNRMTGAIVGRKEIASVQDLKGKRLGIDRVGSNPDMFTQAALSRFQDGSIERSAIHSAREHRPRESRLSRPEPSTPA